MSLRPVLHSHLFVCVLPPTCACRKSIQKGGPGFAYGFVCAMCFTLAFFVLLCGLVLDGFQDTVKDQLEVKCECAVLWCGVCWGCGVLWCAGKGNGISWCATFHIKWCADTA